MFPLLLLGSSLPAQPQSIVLDDFTTLAGWKAVHTHGEGAGIEIRNDRGKTGPAMLMEFAFQGFMGGVMAYKEFPLDLPPNFRFSFDMKADAPVNNFEFRLVDSLGNVWWNNKLDYTFPRRWTTIHIKKRQFTYAWGPSWGGEPQHIAKIELNVSVSSGGKGKIWIDNLRLEPLDDRSAKPLLAGVRASSSRSATEPSLTSGARGIGPWAGASGRSSDTLTLRATGLADLGGVVINWDSLDFATAFDLLLSADNRHWSPAYKVLNGNGGRQYVPTGEKEASAIRLVLKRSSRGRGSAFHDLEVKGPEFSQSANALFTAMAADAPPGCFPKYFSSLQSYWTLSGAGGDTKEALMNEQGQIETERKGFSLEPFLYADDSLVTWHDVITTPSLEQGYLPIPSVTWNHRGALALTITALTSGPADSSVLFARYTVANAGNAARAGKLLVALRPFQVNPPWQIFTIVGGAARIDSVHCRKALSVNRTPVIPLSPPSRTGAATFDQGDVTRYLASGRVPPWKDAVDHSSHASAALEYDWKLEPGASTSFVVAVPFHPRARQLKELSGIRDPASAYEQAHGRAVAYWKERLDNFHIKLPPQAQPVENAIRSNLAYILINKDGPALQPGPRCYKRSWIRDGSMIASSLLQMGVYNDVREYIDWYAKYQRTDGFVPCIVDRRGAEAVPEHDSHGQFIYMIAEYFRFTRDTAWLQGKWDNVLRAASFIRKLRAEQQTDEYRLGTPEEQACYGLVPASISHEGYSARPMHSYWDNFFCLRGLKDAAMIAAVLGEKEQAEELAAAVEDYRFDLTNSLRLAMKNKMIDYVPGCVELGDKGGLSNTIILDPVDELSVAPLLGIVNDLNTFWGEFEGRENGTARWFAYLPYEWRYVGTFVRLREDERAYTLFDALMRDRRPPAWNGWPESLWKDSVAANNLGDMPHAWVGSDFIRAVRSMFAYERGRDTSLVVGAGVPEAWLSDTAGVAVRNLPTHYGLLNYTMKKSGDGVTVVLSGALSLPAAKIVVRPPLPGRIRSVSGDARPGARNEEIVLTRVPATILVQ